MGEAMYNMKPKYLTDIKPLFAVIRNYYSRYADIMTDEAFERAFEIGKSSNQLSDDDVVRLQLILSEARNLKNTERNEGEFAELRDTIILSYKGRTCVDIAKEIISTPNIKSPTTHEDVAKLLENVNRHIADINSTDVDGEREGAIEDGNAERLKRYEAIKENPDSTGLIPTGFNKINEAIIGWNQGEFNIIIGRKGDGKSTFLLNIGYFLWKQGYNVMFFSLEIDKQQYERRWDARAALVSSKGLKGGTLSEHEEANYRKYLECYSKGTDVFGNKVGSVYIVDCPGAVTPSFIDAKIQEVETKMGKEYPVIIIDYMGIMAPNVPMKQLRLDLGSISLDLKRMTRRRKKITFSAVQMNRETAKSLKAKGSPDTTSLAESDQIADNADIIISVRSLDDDTAKIESVKTRDGAPFTFNIRKQYDRFQMSEIEDDGWASLD